MATVVLAISIVEGRSRVQILSGANVARPKKLNLEFARAMSSSSLLTLTG